MKARGAAGWSAIIPLKPAGQRKTRLANHLTAAQRDRLALDMFRHVAATLRAVLAIEHIAALSPRAMPGWAGGWIEDQGRGLNAELRAAAHTRPTPCLLVIHADLPLLRQSDILDLLGTHQAGSSIAPDRHGTGTNALALRNEPAFGFAFGEDSFTRHLAAARAPLRVVERLGLALDVDTQDDLDLVKTLTKASAF